MLRKLLSGLCCLVFSQLLAQKATISPSPEWLYKTTPDLSKIAEKKTISNGYYFDLLDIQTHIASQTEYRHFIRHIVNESGVQNASEVSVSFAPQYQQVFYHKIDLIRDGKIVSSLSPGQIKTVQDESDGEEYQYNGLKRAYVILKDVRKNDLIDVAYSVKGFNPVYANRFSDNIYFSYAIAVTNYYQTIIAPGNRTLLFKRFNNAASPSEIRNAGAIVYHWNNPALKPMETQTGVPSWFDNYPHITVTEYRNWNEVVNWGISLFDKYQYSLPAELENKIAALRKESKGNKFTFTSLATRFVQDQVRYLGLEIGIHTHRPHNPGEVFKQRFGDCKDKALLLAMMLRRENIPAYVALVNTSDKSKLGELQPSPSAFNHAIVAIDDVNTYQFIDPTISYQRGDLAGLYIPAYGYALILKEGTERLERIKPGYKKSTTIVETFNVSNKREGTSSLEVVSEFEGASADNNRSNLADNSVDDMEESFKRYYTKLYDSIQLEKDIDIKDDSLANIITVKERYSIPEIWREEEKGKKSFRIFANPIYEQLPNPSTSYKYGPLAIMYPQNLHYSIILNMPEKWSFPVKELHIRNEAYVFDYKSSIQGNKIILDYSFITGKDHISAEELNQYKSDYKKIIEVLEYEVYRNNLVSQDGSNNHYNGLNWVLILFIVVLGVVLFLAFRVLNKRKTETYFLPEQAQALGGWVVVLGIMLAIGALIQLFSFFTNVNFKMSAWQAIKALDNTRLLFILYIETGFSFVILFYIGSLLYWYFMRRDIFPKMFIIYAILVVCVNLLLSILYTNSGASDLLSESINTSMTQVIRSFISGLVWTLYLMNSGRVKNTFLFPHNYQFSPVVDNHINVPEDGEELPASEN